MDKIEFGNGKVILDENNKIIIKDKETAEQLKDMKLPEAVKLEVKDSE